MSDFKPTLNLEETTNVMKPVVNVFMLSFDEPIAKRNEAKGYDYWMYGVNHDGEEKTLFAYSGLHDAIQRTLNLFRIGGNARGTVLGVIVMKSANTTSYQVNVLDENGEPLEPTEYVPIDGDTISGSAAAPASYSPPAQSARQGYSAMPISLSPDQRHAWLVMAQDKLSLFKAVLTLVQTDADMPAILGGALPLEEVVRIAVTAYIETNRHYHPSMVAGGEAVIEYGDDDDVVTQEFFLQTIEGADASAIMQAISDLTSVEASNIKRIMSATDFPFTLLASSDKGMVADASWKLFQLVSTGHTVEDDAILKKLAAQIGIDQLPPF